MHALRRSRSMQHSCTSDDHQTHHSTNHNLEAVSHRTPSLDTLIIRGRTRYPSDRAGENGGSRDIDESIARALLQAKDQNLRSVQTPAGISHESNQSQNEDSPKVQSRSRSLVRFSDAQPRNVSGTSTQVSQATSGISSLDGATVQNAEKSALRYNEIAKRYGLNEIGSLDDFPENTSTSEEAKFGHRNPILRYLRRSTSSQDVEHRNRNLVRKSSINKLMRKGSKLSLNCSSIEQMYRMGGTSLLSLPKKFTPLSLTIPSCLAATGNFLAIHGPTTPGIFRIPGQTQAVNNLYEYYVAQMRNAVMEGDHVEDSVGFAMLPHTDFVYSVHDIASAFKRFLWDIPGGILGSIKLFMVLREIRTFQTSSSCGPSEWGKARPRLLALALLSMKSLRRMALCSAVFGLLASIKIDHKTEKPTAHRRHPSQERMSSRALSVIFAPILLGSSSDKVDLHSPQSTPETPLASPKRAFMRYFRSSTRSSGGSNDQPIDINISLERSNVAAGIIEMLLQDWELITSSMISFRESSRQEPLTFGGYGSHARHASPYRNRVSILETIQSPDARHNLHDGPTPCPPQIVVTQNYNEPDQATSDHRDTSPTDAQRSDLLEARAEGTFADTESFRKPSFLKVLRSTSATAMAPIHELRGASLHPVSRSSPVGDIGRPWWDRVPRASKSKDGRTNKLRKLTRSEPAGSGASCAQSDMHAKLSLRPNEKASRPRASSNTGLQMPSFSAGNTTVGKIVSNAESAEEPLMRKEDPMLGREPPIQSSHSSFAAVKVDTNEVVSNDKSASIENSHRSTEHADAAFLPFEGNLQQTSRIPEKLQSDEYAQIHQLSHSEPRKPGEMLYHKEQSDEIKHPASSPLRPPQSGIPVFNPRLAQLELKQKKRRSGGKKKRGSPLPAAMQRMHGRATPPQQKNSDPGYSGTCYTKGLTEPSHTAYLESEPAVARQLRFRRIDENRSPTSGAAADDPFRSTILPKLEQKGNVGTLYAEIGRLKQELDAKSERILHLQQEVNAIRYAKDTGTLSEKLRECQRELRMWKQRAQRAETAMFRRPRNRTTDTVASD